MNYDILFADKICECEKWPYCPHGRLRPALTDINDFILQKLDTHDSTKPDCPTKNCIDCFFLSICTKDEPDKVIKKRVPSWCSECGAPMGLLLHEETSVCVICGHRVTLKDVIKE